MKSQIPRACWLNVLCIFGYFSRTPSESVFLLFGLFFGAKGCFRSVLEASKNDAKKRFGAISANFRKWAGGPITSGLWPSWVILPLGPWSLPMARGGPAGNWSRPALEARWRIGAL